jgi:hypothetical protein
VVLVSNPNRWELIGAGWKHAWSGVAPREVA